MADENKNNPNQEVENSNIKPCFEISDSKIFLNLHNSAVEKAAKKINVKFDQNTIGLTIMNTAFSEDGKIFDAKQETSFKKSEKYLGNKSAEYEVAIALELEKTRSINVNTEDEKKDHKVWEKVRKANEVEIDKLHDIAESGLKEYFNWFAGTTEIGDIVEFIPVQQTNKTILSQYKFTTQKAHDIIQFFRNMTDGNSGKDSKIKIGFKVSYKIEYK